MTSLSCESSAGIITTQDISRSLVYFYALPPSARTPCYSAQNHIGNVEPPSGLVRTTCLALKDELTTQRRAANAQLYFLEAREPARVPSSAQGIPWCSGRKENENVGGLQGARHGILFSRHVTARFPSSGCEPLGRYYVIFSLSAAKI